MNYGYKWFSGCVKDNTLLNVLKERSSGNYDWYDKSDEIRSKISEVQYRSDYADLYTAVALKFFDMLYDAEEAQKAAERLSAVTTNVIVQTMDYLKCGTPKCIGLTNEQKEFVKRLVKRNKQLALYRVESLKNGHIGLYYLLNRDNKTDEEFLKMCLDMQLSNIMEKDSAPVPSPKTTSGVLIDGRIFARTTKEDIYTFAKTTEPVKAVFLTGRVTPEILYTIQNDYPNVFRQLRIGCIANGAYLYYPIKKVVDTGEQSVVKVIVNSDFGSQTSKEPFIRSLICTLDTDILTNYGWIKAGELHEYNVVIGHPCFHDYGRAVPDNPHYNTGAVFPIKTFEGITTEYGVKTLSHTGQVRINPEHDAVDPKGKLLHSPEKKHIWISTEELLIVKEVKQAGKQQTYSIIIDDDEIQNYFCNCITIRNKE